MFGSRIISLGSPLSKGSAAQQLAKINCGSFSNLDQQNRASKSVLSRTMVHGLPGIWRGMAVLGRKAPMGHGTDPRVICFQLGLSPPRAQFPGPRPKCFQRSNLRRLVLPRRPCRIRSNLRRLPPLAARVLMRSNMQRLPAFQAARPLRKIGRSVQESSLRRTAKLLAPIPPLTRAPLAPLLLRLMTAPSSQTSPRIRGLRACALLGDAMLSAALVMFFCRACGGPVVRLTPYETARSLYTLAANTGSCPERDLAMYGGHR